MFVKLPCFHESYLPFSVTQIYTYEKCWERFTLAASLLAHCVLYIHSALHSCFQKTSKLWPTSETPAPISKRKLSNILFHLFIMMELQLAMVIFRYKLTKGSTPQVFTGISWGKSELGANGVINNAPLSFTALSCTLMALIQPLSAVSHLMAPQTGQLPSSVSELPLQFDREKVEQ